MSNLMVRSGGYSPVSMLVREISESRKQHPEQHAGRRPVVHVRLALPTVREAEATQEMDAERWDGLA
jgi:hypothetical protein